MTKFERIAWLIYPLAALWLMSAMILTSRDTRARQRAYWEEGWEEELTKYDMEEHAMFPTWVLPDDPAKEPRLVLTPVDEDPWDKLIWKMPTEPPKDGDILIVDWAHPGSTITYLNQVAESKQTVTAALEEKMKSLDWSTVGKPYIILDLSKENEDWEIVVGQSAHEFIVFREKGEAICTIGVVDGALILDGKESKAIEFIKKYFELRK